MAKKTGLIIISFFISFSLFAAAQPDAVTKTPGPVVKAAFTPAPVTASAKVVTVMSADTGTAAAVNAAESVTTVAVSVSVEDNEEIVNLKVKEINLNITPTFKIVLPDASLNLGLKQKFGDTVLEASTEYNYVYNKIKYLIKYGLETFFPVAASLYDNIDFTQIYQNDKYIARVKGLGISVGTPPIFSALKLGEEFNNQEFYFAKLADPLNVTQGLISLLNTWVELKFEDFYYSVNFDKSIPHNYSPYQFLFLNNTMSKVFRFGADKSLLLLAETGHMLEKQNVPIWRMYSLGGYDRLIGYSFNKFQDFFKVFIRAKYDMNLWNDINWTVWWVRLNGVSFFAIADCGRVGDVHQIQILNQYKYSAGIGLSFRCTFRKRTPFIITLAEGKAIGEDVPPVFYFMYEIQ